MHEMDPCEIHTNFHLKCEVLKLAIRISAASPGSADND